MAQTGYTPISIYYSSTTTNVPTAGNLVAGELAINTVDGKLFYKDSSGVVQVIGTKGGVGSSTTTQVLYNSSGLVVGSSSFVFDGTNVGIGTASPNAYGAGYTTAQANGSSGGLLQATVGGSTIIGELYASQGLGLVQVGTRTNHPLAFKTNSVEAMRIDTSGTLSIGTTGGDIFNPSGIVLLGGTNPYAGVMHASGSASGSSYAIFAYNSGIIGSITQTGTTAVLYNTTSDYRLKEDVAPIQNALATVEALNPVSFTWIDGRKDDGFLAHEIQAVIPNCVTGEKDAVNEDGTPKYQQMDNSGVIPFLVKAIQEQQALIESLTTRLTALENK